MGGQIVDATVVEARRPRLTRTEKDTIKGGGMPSGWSKARGAQIDRDGRWTIKHGRKPYTPPDRARRTAAVEIAVPIFGYMHYVGIDREFGVVRRYHITPAIGAAAAVAPVIGVAGAVRVVIGADCGVASAYFSNYPGHRDAGTLATGGLVGAVFGS